MSYSLPTIACSAAKRIGSSMREPREGETIWAHRYHLADGDAGYGVIENPDGTLLVSGYSERATEKAKTLLMKLGASGKVIWTKRFDAGVHPLYPSVRRGHGGSLIVTGQVEPPSSGDLCVDRRRMAF